MSNARSIKTRTFKSSVLTIALLVITSGLVPAEAVRAGDRCSKADARMRIGGERFICSTNPNTNSKRLVWVWAECLVANQAYLKGVDSQKSLAETANETIAMLKSDIEALKVKIAGNEPEAKTWDAKAADYRAKAAAAVAKANELKASASTGGITSVGTGFKRNLQVALLDNKLTTAEVTSLATAWATTVDKVPFIIEFISAEDRLASAKSYELGAKNAERKAASLRSNELIELKERQIKSAETNVGLANSQVNSLKSTRATACDRKVWRAIS